MLKRILLLCMLLIIGSVLFAATVLIVFPADSIGDFITETAREQGGVSLKYHTLERVFPFGIKATGVEVKKPSEGMDIYITSLTLKLEPAGLFMGRVAIRADAELLGGSIGGTVYIGRTAVRGNFDLYSIRPELLPQARKFAVTAPLALSGSIDVTHPYSGCAKGAVVIDSEDGGSEPISALGFGLDFGDNVDAGARVELKDCRADIRSLWVEGENIVARLSGEITIGRTPDRSRLDLLAEVNEHRAVNGNRMLLSFLNAYKVSDGYYRVKVGGTAARPVLRHDR